MPHFHSSSYSYSYTMAAQTASRADVLRKLSEAHAKIGDDAELFDMAVRRAAEQLGVSPGEMRALFDDARACAPALSGAQAMSVQRERAGDRRDQAISSVTFSRPADSNRTNRYDDGRYEDDARSRGTLAAGRHYDDRLERRRAGSPTPSVHGRHNANIDVHTADEYARQVREIRPWTHVDAVYNDAGSLRAVNHITSYLKSYYKKAGKPSHLQTNWDNAERARAPLVDLMCSILNIAGVGKAAGSVWQAYTVLLSGMSPAVPDHLARYKTWFGHCLREVFDELGSRLSRADVACDEKLVYACIGALAAEMCRGEPTP